MRFQKFLFWLALTTVIALAFNGLAESDAPVSPTGAIGETVSSHAIHWIVGLLAAIVTLLGISIVMFWHRDGRTSVMVPPRLLVLPATKSPDDQIPTVQRLLVLPKDVEPVAETPDVEAWKQRALTAEAMAGRQGEILREKMIPELTEFAKQSLVQGLVTQRNVLMETQRKAQQALMELESRMSVLQTPLQERIRVYENRIAELEQAVQTQAEEVRELTRATLALVRNKLAEERGSQQLHSRFN
jgi:hypothetical protein